MKKNKRLILTFCILGLLMSLPCHNVLAEPVETEKKDIDLEEITREYLKFLRDNPKLTLDPGLYEGFDEFYYMALDIMRASCDIWGYNGLGIFRGAIRFFLWLFIPMRLSVWAYWLDGLEIIPDLTDEQLKFLGPVFGFIVILLYASVSLSLLAPMGMLGVRLIHYELVVDIFNWCDSCID